MAWTRWATTWVEEKNYKKSWRHGEPTLKLNYKPIHFVLLFIISLYIGVHEWAANQCIREDEGEQYHRLEYIKDYNNLKCHNTTIKLVPKPLHGCSTQAYTSGNETMTSKFPLPTMLFGLLVEVAHSLLTWVECMP